MGTTSKMKFKETGSFYNLLMGNNSTYPKVGEGATVLLWSDRHAYEVIEFDERQRKVVLARYQAKRVDNLGMSDHQEYEYKEFTQERMTLYYRYGGWKQKHVSITFEDHLGLDFHNHRSLHDGYKAKGGKYCEEGIRMRTVIPGYTRLKTEWHTVKIIFGVKKEYYDFSF